jgi:hypothetical protein
MPDAQGTKFSKRALGQKYGSNWRRTRWRSSARLTSLGCCRARGQHADRPRLRGGAGRGDLGGIVKLVIGIALGSMTTRSWPALR